MAQPYISLRRLTTFVTSLADTVNAKIDTSAIKNNDTTTSSGYVADARIVKTHGDEIDTHTTQLGGLYFGTDSSGNWGYATTSAGDVTPFRNPTGNATAAQLLSGYVASNATTEDFTGTMNNWGSNTITLSSSNTATRSAGYYSSITANAAGRYTAGYNAGYNDGYNANANSGYNSGYAAAMVGTANAAQVLNGYTFTNANTVGATGTMNNWGANTITLSSSNTATRSAGYYSSISVNAAGLYSTAYNAGYSAASITRTSVGAIKTDTSSYSFSCTDIDGYSDLTVTNFAMVINYIGGSGGSVNVSATYPNFAVIFSSSSVSMAYTASSGTLTVSGACAYNSATSTSTGSWYYYAQAYMSGYVYCYHIS